MGSSRVAPEDGAIQERHTQEYAASSLIRIGRKCQQRSLVCLEMPPKVRAGYRFELTVFCYRV